MSGSKKGDWTPLSPDILAWLTLPLIGGFALLVVYAMQYLRQRVFIADFLVAVGLGVVGIGLLFFARLPLYRQRRFMTFGPRHLDSTHRKLYWRAYGFVAVSVALLALLLVCSR
jgi:hypothetical protein